MKSKLGILSALVLSLAIAGSAFASTGKASVKKNTSAAKSAAGQKAKTSKSKKHHKTKKLRSAKKMKNTMTATPQK